MNTQSRRELGRPVVDETAFQQLLSAAYVMQEHNGRLKKVSAPKPPQSATPAVVKPPIAVPITPAPAQPIPFPVTPLQASTNPCRECGSVLAADEFFCENCGAPAERTGSTTQKNWASLWEMHHASAPAAKVPVAENKVPFASAAVSHAQDTTEEEIALFPAELEEIVGKFDESETGEEPNTETTVPEHDNQGLALVPATPGLTASKENNTVAHAPATWTSAAKARAWLDSLKPQQKSTDWFREEWNFHRGIISIALASAVLLAVLFQWATHPLAAPGQPRELSGFEQMLVSMGLAEAPTPVTTTVAPGNPNTKVWVDVHTALYYCPGADLYGKTSDGRYTSQLDAQRDHFQPSTLKACD